MKPIEPENPTRLRDLIDALAQHREATVLRLEIQFVPSSDDDEQTSLRLILTHSLGPDRELALIPLVAQTLSAAFDSLHDDGKDGQ